MSVAPVTPMDVAAPPVVKTIRQRSLLVGIVFSAIAIAIAVMRPDEFFPAYILGFMAWLGVSLGSMAILMIRHLTGGGWGVVVRRQMGAAMRCLPMMTVLFVPVLFGLPRLYIWARPLDSVADAKARAHLQSITESYLNPH